MDPTVPKGAALLLDFIRETEVGRSDRASYDTIYGHNQRKLAKPITTMTIGDLVDLQGSLTKKFGSSASGGYQFMRGTLQDLARELGLRGTQIFDPNLQDRLAYHLLKRRGYEAYMAGKLNRTEFGNRLAQEWASFPVLATTKGASRQVGRGQSYYAGDGLNKALVSPERLEAVLDDVKAAGNELPPKRTLSPAALPQGLSSRPGPIAIAIAGLVAAVTFIISIIGD
jgi:muramidase (phage lysozyme)